MAVGVCKGANMLDMLLWLPRGVLHGLERLKLVLLLGMWDFHHFDDCLLLKRECSERTVVAATVSLPVGYVRFPAHNTVYHRNYTATCAVYRSINVPQYCSVLQL